MYKLLAAKKEGTKIYYRDKKVLTWIEVEDGHAWNLQINEYDIRARREFIVSISKGGVANIKETHNNWTRSDFGLDTEGNDYVLMREVYREEM